MGSLDLDLLSILWPMKQKIEQSCEINLTCLTDVIFKHRQNCRLRQRTNFVNVDYVQSQLDLINYNICLELGLNIS